MTPTELIAAFESLAEAPDGVVRLRELILQLALRGKLVSQDPRDGVAGTVPVQEERSVGRADAELQGSPRPWGIPQSWAWTRTVDLGELSPRSECADAQVVAFCPMPTIPTEFSHQVRPERREWGQIKKGYTHFAKGDVVVAKITPCFQNSKSCVMQETGAGTTELHVVRPKSKLVTARYLLLFYKSPYFLRGGVAQMTGTAGQQRVPRDYFANAPLPLPPLAEQHRIVARVDELMGLLDRLEAARAKRETTRAAARDSVLAALREADSSEEVDAAWTRFAQRMDDMVCDPADIAPLRQAVLQLAVRGRLVAQDPKDEPANILMERIAAEGARHLQARGRRERCLYTGASQDQVPFQIPGSWRWARTAEVAQLEMGLTILKHELKLAGVPVYSAGRENRPWGFIGEPERVYDQGTVVISARGTIGFPRVPAESRFISTQTTIGAKPILIEPHYLRISLDCLDWKSLGSGGSIPMLTVGTLSKAMIPIPPLDEQRRIVGRVEELIGLLDRLEARLAAGKAVHEAFAAAAVHHLET